MRRVKLGDVAAVNPRAERLPTETVVSFVGMAQLDAVTAEARPLSDREYGEVAKGYTQFRDGDILAAKITPCWENGKVGVARLDHAIGVGSTEFHVVRPNPELDTRYLLHYLRRAPVRASGELRMTGSGGQRRVPVNFLTHLDIPLPPIHEQRRIAAILDQADAIRTKRRQVFDHLGALPRSLFADVATRDGVQFRILGDVVTTSSGGTPDRKNVYYYGGEIPWVKSGELHRDWIDSTEESITSMGLAAISASLLPKGTVVMAMYGATAGVVSQLGVDAVTNQAICAFRPGGEIRATYLKWALRAQTASLLERRTGGAQPNLSQGTIKALSIPVVPIVAQDEFVSHVDAIAESRRAIERALRHDDELFASLQARAFRGEL